MLITQLPSDGINADIKPQAQADKPPSTPLNNRTTKKIDQAAKTDVVTIAGKQTQVSDNENDRKPAGVVSHVVVSYNLRGEMRTKFEDSRNNVVYQVPSVMVAKMQDLMMSMNVTTNVEG